MSEPARPDLDLIEKYAERSWLPPEDTRALVAYARWLETALNTACNDLRDIANTSPNWMEPDAVANSEREMRRMAEDAQRRATDALLGKADA